MLFMTVELDDSTGLFWHEPETNEDAIGTEEAIQR